MSKCLVSVKALILKLNFLRFDLIHCLSQCRNPIEPKHTGMAECRVIITCASVI